MNCTFIGHRDAPNEIKKIVKETIVCVIKREGVKKFFVGNNGNFDFYVQCVLQELKEEGEDIHFDIVLSRLDEKAITGNQNKTIFPEGLEKAAPKFSIVKRNDWLIRNSSILIAYVPYKISNSGRIMEKAYKRGLKIINIAQNK